MVEKELNLLNNRHLIKQNLGESDFSFSLSIHPSLLFVPFLKIYYLFSFNDITFSIESIARVSLSSWKSSSDFYWRHGILSITPTEILISIIGKFSFAPFGK